MKVRTTAAALGALALVATLGVFTPADAGQGSNVNFVRVDKVVDGPVPEGTVFEVEVDCSATSGVPPTLKFDAAGVPLNSNTVFASIVDTCTVTETVTGGATVSYACQVDQGNDAGPRNVAEPAEPSWVAECTDSQTVDFGEVSGETVVITVTNTFEPEPEPEPEREPEQEAAPAGVVAARPTFTG